MNNSDGICWYVMTHPEMRRFQEWIKEDNAQRLSDGRAIVEPFYPSDYLKDAVSDDLSNILFLKATKADIDSLVNDLRNTLTSKRLRYYLDTDGQQATVSDQMMQEFLNACIEHAGRLEITPPLNSIELKDKVKIIGGPFTGYEASVSGVKFAHGAIQLDLDIQLVQGVMTIRMCDVKKNQIQILNREAGDAIRADFIEYTQNHLLHILEHRVKRVDDEAVNRRDADMLTRLYRYRHYEIKTGSSRYHFLALMLICAHLCRYKADEAELCQQALAVLDEINQRSKDKAATDTRTYLWIALYISTNDPVYRDAAKQYVRDHQPKSPKLRQFVSLIREGKKV